MSAEEQLLQLFDSYWFEYEIFTSKPNLSTPPTTAKDPDFQVHEQPEKSTLIVRSFSDQFLSSKDGSHSENSNSPKSVLGSKLQTILSGKEVEEFSTTVSRNNEAVRVVAKTRTRSRTRRRKGGNSKSLSELEFEELKGFMDLGFVFSDEDKDSSLVSIIPGLQRMGKEEAIDESEVSRPYLSEAWEVLNNNKVVEEEEEEEDPLMNWRIPAFGNEIELKNHIKFWAHSVAVASTVK